MYFGYSPHAPMLKILYGLVVYLHLREQAVENSTICKIKFHIYTTSKKSLIRVHRIHFNPAMMPLN